METNKINVLIKGLVKEFEIEGTKTFLKNFNIATGKVENMSIFIGKIKNFTFMSNGKVLMGYMNREGASAIQFTFRNLNELPWTNIYEPELKIFVKRVVDTYFKTNAKLMSRYNLIIEAADNYDEIAIRALRGKIINIKELKPATRIVLLGKMKREGAVASSLSVSNNIPKVSNEETVNNNIPKVISDEIAATDHKLTPMQLAHKIRKDEKLEGHYHAQMKYALKKAYEMLKETGTLINNVQEDFNKDMSETNKEVALDESTSIKEPLTLKEVLEKYKDQYKSFVYFEGFNITISINGQTKTMSTKYKGIKLEKEFIPKLGIFKDKTLIIHHYDVFEPQENIDFIMIP